LESGGHSVVEAANGRQALEIFRNNAADLVITDLIMPEQEGIETILLLRERNPAVKIVAISGGGRTRNMDFLEIASKAGADMVLPKPFDAKTLLRTVQECLV
jgi:CheY-like chemotaxis protein